MKVTKDVALFYGILMGDGCLSRCGTGWFVVITCHIHDDRPFFDDIVIPLTTKLRGKNVKYAIRPKYGKIEINFSDKELFNKIKSLGFPVGLKGNMSIPDVFSRKLLKHIVSGLFATDGSLFFANNNGTLYPRLEIHMIASNTIYRVQEFLAENGIKGNVYKRDRKENHHQAIFRIEIPGRPNLLKFRKVIGFINPKHEDKFQKYMAIKNS